MSVNLNKHKAALQSAWDEIHNPNGKNNWVLFGYEGQSSDLKVVSQGEDGLEELVDDLNNGKILYGGLRVTDPNTNLPKIVFINWQGEGVPPSVKGTCANHLRDITNFFKGVHVQINARSEDDVDEKVILEKVKSSSGANYSFHKEKKQDITPQGLIGTNYERQQPAVYIAQSNKDKFWAQNEKEEKHRKEEETRRAQEERMVESRARAEREKKEAARREDFIRERARSIDEQRKAEAVSDGRRTEEEKQRYEATLKESRKDDEEFRNRSDSERRKRLQEANQLIRKRQESFGETSPRDVFEKKAAAPPTTPKKKAVAPPPTKTRQQPPLPREPSPEVSQRGAPEPIKQPFRQLPPEPVREPSPEPIREPSPEPVREPSPEPIREPSPEPVREPSPEPVREPSPEPVRQVPLKAKVSHSSEGLTAKALYDYQAADDTEISFDPDDIISNIEIIDEGWWRGTTPNGHYGMFPANYVVLMESTQALLNPPVEEPAAEKGVCARALYDYQAADETEISFDPHDVITNIEQIDEGWWRGEGPDGRFGLFPANYVELI